MSPQPPPPFPPAVDTPRPQVNWEGVVALAINQLEERVEARLDLFHQELALLRGSGQQPVMLPPPPVELADTLPPPSRRVKAMRFTGKATQILGVLTLLVTAAAQIASLFKPGLVGPLQAFAEFLKGFAQ